MQKIRAAIYVRLHRSACDNLWVKYVNRKNGEPRAASTSRTKILLGVGLFHISFRH